MITKNAEELLEKSLSSCKGLVNEIVVVDNNSTDRTLEILRSFKAKIYQNKEDDLGKQRAYGLRKVTNDWVLVLDSDEIVSKSLKDEIKKMLSLRSSMTAGGYLIPFQNHFLGRPINHGGENYKKLILFNKKFIKVDPALVHEKFKAESENIGVLKNKIYHYSYRSVRQMFTKFTDYAVREAKQKINQGEHSSFKKIFLYPIHMFWARFIKDKGYKDGLFRIPLDLGFAYMELMTYVLVFLYGR